jgi:cellulose synthase/poly-beta-1,6-N-acetylglucosamine synthase-like glycosyltransferase
MNKPKVLGIVGVLFACFVLLHVAFPYIAPFFGSYIGHSYVWGGITGLFTDFAANWTSIFLFALMGLIIYFGVIFIGLLGPNRDVKEFFTPEVSVVICAKNEAALLQRTLDSLVASDYPKEKMQIILVVSNSTDDSDKFCEDYVAAHPGFDWEVLSSPLEKPGKPPALNLGVSLAKHEFLVIYDAGSILLPSTLKNLVTPMKDGKIDATFGAITVKNWNKNTLTQGILMDYALVSGGNSFAELNTKLGKNCWLYGRNVCIRMSTLKELGGFSEESLTEDLFLASYMNAYKKKVMFVAKAKAYEMVPSDWDVLKKQRMRWVGGFTGDIPKLLQLKVNNKNIGGPEMMNRFLTMQLLGNISIWCVFDLAFIVAYLLVGELYLLFWTAICLIFHFGYVLLSIKRYGDGHFSALKHFGTVLKIHGFMFTLSTHLPKVINWEATPQLLTMSDEEVKQLLDESGTETSVSSASPEE